MGERGGERERQKQTQQRERAGKERETDGWSERHGGEDTSGRGRE